jgi:hypothetical protein
MADIPYVCLYRSYYEELENFSPEERGRLLWALLEYLCTGQEPELPAPESYFWPRLRSQHQRDALHYNEVCERNRTNGVKGGKLSARLRASKTEKHRKVEGGVQQDEHCVYFEGGLQNAAMFIPVEAVAPKEREKEKEKEREKEKHTITECSVCNYPSKEEVILFCRQEGLTYVDAERFVAYYNSIGWVIKGQPIKDWKAAAILWNQRERAKAGEGSGLEDTWNPGGIGTVV